MKRETPPADGFRVRGEEVTRLEGFSDAVFGFALTLLVVSLEVPKTFADLMASDAAALFVIYGAGYAAVFGALALLYWHGYRRRDELDLTEVERLDTRWEIGGLLCQVSIGLVSIVIALVVPPRQLGWAGFVYFPLALIMGVHGAFRARSVDRARQRFRKPPEKQA